MTALTAFLLNLAVTAVVVGAVMLATFAVAVRVGRHGVVDVAWGLGFVGVAVSTAVVATATGTGDPARIWLLAALTAVWGLRLAVHIGLRGRGKGEDPRYERFLANAPGNRNLHALRVVYLLQGSLLLLISLPLQVAAHTAGPLGWLAFLGVLVWLTGFAFESVGDAQLARFKADPANRGRIMDRGLWAWTRHPNYFGDALVWWGLFLVAAGSWWVLLTLPAPLLMTYLLTRGSGQRLLDEHMSGRPGWSEYVARTSAFVPLPPKRAAARE
ncbi:MULTISPECIES: DUF1295 domain-containing protein [Nocardiopsis]|uniref:DUF1295 domain-containing protein n=1 Tax=Nocardiopsis TaxID=2013 RepID=UPI000346E560|nr:MULTISPECIES: DUF1295 domain-containing protein [Nocardiopsis]PWV54709.1 steroid 5-alpha reductase family enzyme [Nocardiopsis sp. L17-MgMaSL7]